ncbi:hypothetical protein B0A55_02821 [Friedmanniomyces simplex]|uniref:Transcription initiation factor TFIID subunit 8 n=1 Tax=Friedmanniomyces simplex TaxID=329884 RepID=A0A4U0XQ79_9PEZI|nr:hypothetical protein B0A55_02821 [Friedmanniomyces simplex]
MPEKRPLPSSGREQQPRKRRRTTHTLRHVQRRPENVEPAPPDPAFAQGQLLRSISAALNAVGFDGVKPTALEMFRSHTEEYMLRFAAYIRTSMQAQRRTRPVAQDFSMALSLMPNTATASLLKPHLGLPIPESISYPSITDPAPPEAPIPDFSALLQPLTTASRPRYIPTHFPALPPKHSWVHTPVYAEREKDARKMREKATQEGMLAEQALRKLATAAKAGALNAEKRRGNALSGPGKVRNGTAVSKRVEDRRDTFVDVMKEVGGVEEEGELDMEGANGDALEDGIDTGMPDGVVVNYNMEDLGKRLLVEVEEVGLDEIFHLLRLQARPSSKSWFNVQQLDRLVLETTPESHLSSSKTNKPTQPIIELTSPNPGSGKTHFLYLLTALAVLPSDLGGKDACVVIIDTDATFSVPRLAQQVQLIIENNSTTGHDVGDIVLSALKRIHIFHPQSFASTLSSLDSLPAYLFDKTRHYSLDRPVSFIALDSASAFYWQAKAEAENASFLASTAPDAAANTTRDQQPSVYAQLASAVKATSAAFCCPVVITSRHLSPTPTPTPHDQSAYFSHSLRPSLPAPLSTLSTLRLISHRLPIRKFPAGISVEEARRGAVDRQEAVEAGKYACVINEWDVDERILRRLQKEGGGGMGFGFRIMAEGLRVDGNEAGA